MEHWRAFAGLFALPLVPAGAWLDRHWGATGAPEFARPCAVWTLGIVAMAAAVALGRPLVLGEGSWLPALVVLPAGSATLAIAWRRAGRAPALGAAMLLAAAAIVVATRALGGDALALALAASGSACAMGVAAWLGRPALACALSGVALPVVGGALGAASFGVLTGAPPPESAIAWLAVAAAAGAVARARSSRLLWLTSLLSLLGAAAIVLSAPAALRLLPGALAVALLVLDGLARHRPDGAIASLGRDAYALALAGIAGQIAEVVLLRDVFAVAPSAAALSPLEPLVIATALLTLRDRRRWQAYAALACLLLSVHAVPRAIGPAAACTLDGLAAGCERLAEGWLVGTGGALVALACLVRARRRLGELRQLFSEPMLDLAALAAPLGLLRIGWSFVAHAGHVEPHLLVRRALTTLAAASLAAVTHRSRLHALVAAGSLVLLGHAVALGGTAGPVGVAAAAIGSLGLGWTLMRSTFVRGWLGRAGTPVAVLGRYSLPGAPGVVLFTGPLAFCGGLGAIGAAAAVGVSAAQVGPTPLRLGTEAVLALFAWLACAWPLEGAPRWMPRLLGHVAAGALVLFAIDARRLGGAGVHALDLSLLALGCALAGRFLERRRGHPPAVAASEQSILLLCAAIVASIGPGAWDPAPLAIGAGVAFVRWRRYPGLTAHPVVVLAGGALYLGIAGPTWSPLALLAVANALCGVAWVVRRFGAEALASPARTWARLCAWTLVLPCVLALVEPRARALADPSPARVAGTLAVTAAALLWLRRGRLDWLLGAAATALVLGAMAPESIAAWSLAALGWQGLDHLARRRGWRASLVLGAIAPATAVTLMLLLPLVGAALAALPALMGREPAGTVGQIGVTAAIGALYSLSSPRLTSGWTGIAAAVSFNLAVCLFWLHTGRHDPLCYAISVGLTLVIFAQVHRGRLSAGARRGLRTVGALLVYLTGLVEVLSFAGGGHALVLGGLALCGIVLGFVLAVRDLFVLGSAVLMLDVISNLTYQGIQRPVVGWTLLTALGLAFTAAGVLFQLRRAEVVAFLLRARHAMATWDSSGLVQCLSELRW